MPLVLAVSGSAIFLLVVLVILLGAIAALFTRRGSGIDQHPQGGDRREAPGVAEGPSRISAADEPGLHEGEPPSTHGTR